MKIVSGGQTGVDRAALDAALALGVPAGGWCPRGRLAEDGVIPNHYPLQELEGGYLARTERNVVDSDATLILHFGPLSGGTARTLDFCRSHRRPCLLIDGEKTPPDQAAEETLRFIHREGVEVLNVAGPRASGEPRAYPYAREVLELVLRQLEA